MKTYKLFPIKRSLLIDKMCKTQVDCGEKKHNFGSKKAPLFFKRIMALFFVQVFSLHLVLIACNI